MWWFKARSRPRKTMRQELRLAVERLESREAAGNVWLPASPIDISGLTWDSRIFVAGDVVELAISGTGLDWDVWMNDVDQSAGSSPDSVTITWSGVSCEVFDGGRRALCTLGSRGSPGIFDIVMNVDDAAVTGPGDTGSRDDEAVQFTANLKAIWVTIGLNAYGPMDEDDEVLKAFEPRGLGQFGLSGGGAGEYPGVFHRVELVGTISPSVPDGTGVFHWEQTADVRWCTLKNDGIVSGGGDFRDHAREGPFAGTQTATSKNSKTFMIDAPGARNPLSQSVAALNTYMNLTTFVKFSGTRASWDFKWHVWANLHGDSTGWIQETSQIQVGVGHIPTGDLPPATSPIPQDGAFNVDCSNQSF